MNSQDMKAASAFIKFLREKESAIMGKLVEKRNECINKLEENERRLVTIIPREILDMNAGEFLERHEGDFDEIMMSSRALTEFPKSNVEVKNDGPDRTNEARFNSPPKKSYKKVIIRKNK